VRKYVLNQTNAKEKIQEIWMEDMSCGEGALMGGSNEVNKLGLRIKEGLRFLPGPADIFWK
jgi:hypothetical protein